MMNTTETIALEKAHQLTTYRKMPVALVRGEGGYVWDAEDRRYLDFYGGHCVTILGHCPPRVVGAIQRQAGDLLFYSNAVYSPVRARAAALMAQVAPEGMAQVFFCNSGTEANETALKIARKATGRSGIVALEGDFHGRTLGSLATTWTEAYRTPYADVLPATTFVPVGDLSAAEAALKGRDVAAVILEPIQSMAGVVEVPQAYLAALRTLCDQYGTLLIFDEVQTGVGRTGTFSISEALGVRPDLITMAKSLGSGVPVGATLVSEALAATVTYGDQGTTFGGGMLAMAAVTATLETILDEGLMDRALAIQDTLTLALAQHGVQVRGRGCLLGLVLDGPARPVIEALRGQGVLVGSAGDPHVIRIMPPLNTSDDDLQAFLDAYEACLIQPST